MIDKFKKEIGFIKNGSSKKNIRHFEASNSESSDSFSSFEYDPHKERQEQFSPYRHPIGDGDRVRPYSKEEKRMVGVNKPSNSPPKFSNQILRNNFIREFNENSKQTNLGRRQQKESKGFNHEQYCEKKEVDNKLINKVQIPNDDFEQELSLSNIHKFQKSKQTQKEEFIEVQNRNTKQHPKQKRYLQPDSSSSDQSDGELETLQKKQTIKQPRQKQARPQEQEELIIEYDKRQFKDKSIKRAILEQNNQKPKGKGTYETKGGICFELDTRQFKGPQTTGLPKKKKKKTQVDERLLLVQRRQLAKMYDREARGKVFGYY